jgi:hypothetical protein
MMMMMIMIMIHLENTLHTVQYNHLWLSIRFYKFISNKLKENKHIRINIDNQSKILTSQARNKRVLGKPEGKT